MSSDKDSQTKEDVDLCIFHDIFRRADKNDDGAISWTEFASYFSDGIVTDDGMRSLFNEIDSHHTNNIDTHELCIYFSQRLGHHEPVFQAAAALCNAVSASVKSLADTHARKTPSGQFVDRFLLREICAHLEAQLQVLRNAHESLRRRARDSASAAASAAAASASIADAAAAATVMPPTPQSPPPPPPPRPPAPLSSSSNATGGGGGGGGRHHSISSHPDTPQTPTRVQATSTQRQPRRRVISDAMDGPGELDDDGCLHWEVARLQRLLDRLESRTALVTGGTVGGRIEETVLDEEEPVILIVRRRLTVQEEQMGTFQGAVKKYSAGLESVTSCLFLSVRQYRETGSVVLFEFWESLGSWRKFLPSPVSKELRRAIVDCTEAPENTETLLLPSAWWKNLEH